MKQKGFAPILIVLLIVLGVGGYLIYQKQGKPATQPQQTTQPVPTLLPNPESSASTASPTPTGAGETANWKTYTNTEYKFSFKYPSVWAFEDSSELGLGSASEKRKSGYQIILDNQNHTTSAGSGKAILVGAINVLIYNKNNYNFFSDNVDDYYKSSKVISAKLKDINDIEVKEIHHTSCPTNNDCISVIFKKGENIFNFDTSVWEDRYKDLNTIYQILSTLKFTQ